MGKRLNVTFIRTLPVVFLMPDEGRKTKTQ